MNDPSVSVFKGFGLSKEAEEYLSSHGLRNAIYSIDAKDVQDDLFGQLIICPFRVRFRLLCECWMFLNVLNLLSVAISRACLNTSYA